MIAPTRTLMVLGMLLPCLGMAGSVTGHSSPLLQSMHVRVPSAPVLVRVSGNILNEGAITIDLAGQAFDPSTVDACLCPWMGGEHSYRGVLLLDVLEMLGIGPGSPGVELRGANGYRVRIRTEDLRRHRYLLAFEMDGVPLRNHPEQEKLGEVMTVVEFSNPGKADLGVYKFQFVWKLEEIRVL